MGGEEGPVGAQGLLPPQTGRREAKETKDASGDPLEETSREGNRESKVEARANGPGPDSAGNDPSLLELLLPLVKVDCLLRELH